MKTKFSNNNLLSSAVLVLNANYSPMTVCTAKRAISLYFLDKIDILSNYDESISSPSLSLELPSVIKIRTYVKNNNTEDENAGNLDVRIIASPVPLQARQTQLGLELNGSGNLNGNHKIFSHVIKQI